MRINLFLMAMIFVSVGTVDKFCAHDRKLLLTGVLNYEDILFAYSWKDIKDFQQQIVWRFQITGKGMVEIGNSLSVEQVFPGIPLFRAGFGLTLKCDLTDTKCNLYNKLVFVFFQTYYKVFRFQNDRFVNERNASNIPWQLESRGDAKDFSFKSANFDTVNAAAFTPGYQAQIFIVSKNILFKSLVDVRAPSLKWTQLVEDKILDAILGAFVSGSEIIFNRKESSDGIALIYDYNGKETKRTTVWEYFGCIRNESELNSEKGSGKGSGQKQSDVSSAEDELNNRYAAIIISVVIIAIIISNTCAAIFWLSVAQFPPKEKLGNPS